MAYCKASDITLGSFTPPRGLNVETVIEQTALDIDAVLGRIYKLPLRFDSGNKNHAAAENMLKTLNRYLTTGTIVIQAGGSRQDDSLNSYGLWYLNQAKDLLRKIESEKIVLPVDRVELEAGSFSGPYIVNRDSHSRVDAFYDNGILAPMHREQGPVTSWPV